MDNNTTTTQTNTINKSNTSEPNNSNVQPTNNNNVQPAEQKASTTTSNANDTTDVKTTANNTNNKPTSATTVNATTAAAGNNKPTIGPMDQDSQEYIKANLSKIESATDAYELFKDTGKLKDFVVGIKQYHDFLIGPKKDSPIDYISASYRFYNLVIKHLNTTNYAIFKLKLQVLLKVLYKEKNGVLNIINILRYDHYWTYGTKTRISYYLFMTYLEGISNPKTRVDELKRLDINSLTSYLPEQIIINLRRFFNI